MLRSLRWFLVIPVAWASWYVVLVAGIMVHSALEALCPSEYMISGMCTAPWFRYAERVVICAGAGLAAALILLTSTLVAPSHRAKVVVVALSVGSLIALIMGILAEAYPELVTAVVVGGVTAAWLLKRGWVQTSSNPTLLTDAFHSALRAARGAAKCER